MRENEDEPADVQQATPVTDEIKADELEEARARLKRETHPKHQCPKQETITAALDCCEVKRRIRDAAENRPTVRYVFKKLCKVDKLPVVPRECMSRQEHLDYLATPKLLRSIKCPLACEKVLVASKSIPMSPRIEELARPHRRRLLMTLQERADILAPHVLYNLIENLEVGTAMTPEQAEKLMRDKKLSKCSKSKKRKKRDKLRCQGTETLAGGDPISSEFPEVDMEAAMCMYSMAHRFVRSILNFKIEHSVCDCRDIAEVILDNLSRLLDYEPIGNEDKKSQQMRCLADLFAAWIADILMQVADKYKAELERECQKKREELEKLAMLQQYEVEEEEEEEDGEDEETIDSEELEAEGLVSEVSGTIKSDLLEYEMFEDQMKYEEYDRFYDASTQFEDEFTSTKVMSDLSEIYDEEEAMEADLVEDGIQTELVETTDAETEDKLSKALAAEGVEICDIESLASKITERAFVSDVPWLTYAKVFDTVYTMIEKEAENCLEDAIVNRLHRDVYKKLEAVVENEAPELLTDRIKDVLDVMAGKVAKFVAKTMDDQQRTYLREHSAKVESTEVRSWCKWLINTADLAEDWTKTIVKTKRDVVKLKCDGQLTRGDWIDWTSKFETKAALWRRLYLDARHKQHHNTMMITNRKVVKTGTLGCPKSSEKTIKNTNYERIDEPNLQEETLDESAIVEEASEEE